MLFFCLRVDAPLGDLCVSVVMALCQWVMDGLSHRDLLIWLARDERNEREERRGSVAYASAFWFHRSAVLTCVCVCVCFLCNI